MWREDEFPLPGSAFRVPLLEGDSGGSEALDDGFNQGEYSRGMEGADGTVNMALGVAQGPGVVDLGIGDTILHEDDFDLEADEDVKRFIFGVGVDFPEQSPWASWDFVAIAPDFTIHGRISSSRRTA